LKQSNLKNVLLVLTLREQTKGKYSKDVFLLDNDVAVIQDKHTGIIHNKIAIIDGRILFMGSYNWSKSAEEGNEENLLEFMRKD